MASIVRIDRFGPPSVLRLTSAGVPTPGRGEVRITQDAIGVNFFDTMARAGLTGSPLPTVLGVEGAGTVDAVGPETSGFSVGDRVGYFFSPGGYATQRLIRADALVKLPEDIGAEQAATFLAKGLTAWMAVRALHPLQPGETVLVQGASGSVGALVSRWARVLGATVIGVAGSPAKLARVRAGAEVAVSSSDPDVLDSIHSVAPHGVDVVYDFVGRAVIDLTRAAVRDGGTIAAIGAASGPSGQDGTDLHARGVRVLGGSTPQYVDGRTSGTATSELFEQVRTGAFADLPVARYALADVATVHEDIAARRLAGLPVLLP